MLISLTFDVQLKIIRPALTKGLDPFANKGLSPIPEFKFTKPKQVEVETGVFLSQEEHSVVAPLIDAVKSRLSETLKNLDLVIQTIDQRCQGISVVYDINKKSDEAIASSCEKIYGSATGTITYSMYTKAVETLHKLDRFLAHKTILNEGTLDGA
jgi:hypothetical protein